MAKKGSNLDLVQDAILILKSEGIETSTYKELAEKSGVDVGSIRLLYHKNPELQELFPIDKKYCGGRPKDTEESKLEKEIIKHDEIIEEADLTDYNQWDEPLFNVNGKITLLRDALYVAATRHNIPEGAETYWIDGKIPRGIGHEGCTVSNIGIRLKK